MATKETTVQRVKKCFRRSARQHLAENYLAVTHGFPRFEKIYEQVDLLFKEMSHKEKLLHGKKPREVGIDMLLIHSADFQSLPVVITVLTQFVRTSNVQNCLKQKKSLANLR